jgi:very-short-patch-repair endonuclease
MPARGIIAGHKVSSARAERARQLRKQMTRAEGLLCKALRRGSLEDLHFRRQQAIAGFIVDLYCHAVRLVVQLDGSIQEQIESDAERDAILSGMDLRLLRINNDDVISDLADVRRRIVAYSRPNPRPLP